MEGDSRMSLILTIIATCLVLGCLAKSLYDSGGK
ncbi:hypothetical protein VPHD530_0015 [Vibrio phage D530]